MFLFDQQITTSKPKVEIVILKQMYQETNQTSILCNGIKTNSRKIINKIVSNKCRKQNVKD